MSEVIIETSWRGDVSATEFSQLDRLKQFTLIIDQLTTSYLNEVSNLHCIWKQTIEIDISLRLGFSLWTWFQKKKKEIFLRFSLQ